MVAWREAHGLTNIQISALSFGGALDTLLDLARMGKIQFVISEEIIEKVARDRRGQEGCDASADVSVAKLGLTPQCRRATKEDIFHLEIGVPPPKWVLARMASCLG